MRHLNLLVACVALCASPAAHAQSSSLWRINGAISGRTFALNCRLEPRGGTCTDAAPHGKSHELTSFWQSGDQARWSFSTRVLLARIALRFDGRIEGNRMKGVVTAAGRTGSFTAVRS